MPPKTRADKSSKAEPSLMNTRQTFAIGIVFGVLFLGSSYWVFHQHIAKQLIIPHLHSLTDRLVYTLRYQTIGIICILLSVSQIGILRVRSNAINPLSGYESIVEKAIHILNITVVHFIVNALNQLVVSTYLNEDRLKLIPLLNFYFLIGRVSYWIGFHVSPKYRSFGFTVTALPNVILTALNLYFLVTVNQNYLLESVKSAFSSI